MSEMVEAELGRLNAEIVGMRLEFQKCKDPVEKADLYRELMDMQTRRGQLREMMEKERCETKAGHAVTGKPSGGGLNGAR